MEQLENIASRLERATEETAALAAESRVKFDAMVEMQSDERLKMQEMFAQEKKDLLDHFAQSDKRKNKIIMGLIIVLVVLIGSLVGGAIYLFTNFDFAVATYQQLDINGDGTQTIQDGIHYNSTTN